MGEFVDIVNVFFDRREMSQKLEFLLPQKKTCFLFRLKLSLVIYLYLASALPFPPAMFDIVGLSSATSVHLVWFCTLVVLFVYRWHRLDL